MSRAGKSRSVGSVARETTGSARPGCARCPVKGHRRPAGSRPGSPEKPRAGWRTSVGTLVLVVGLSASAGWAQVGGGAGEGEPADQPTASDAGEADASRQDPTPIENPRETRQPDELEGVEITQNLGDQLPLDAEMTTEDGESVKLRDYFNRGDSKPVILNLAYYECPVLCSLIMDRLGEAIAELGWVPGEDFRIVTLTINHRETPSQAREKKQQIMRKLDMEGAGDGWHFHTADKGTIERVANAAGFGYKYLPDQKQYVHKPALVLAGPDGTITRYLLGLNYPPFRLKGSLMDASDGQVGSVVDKVVMSCFQYQDDQGKYTATAFGIVRLGGALTVLALVSAIGLALVREFIRRQHGSAGPSDPAETSEK